MDSVGVQSEDAELVARSLSGERSAFADIVTRYQTLICSLTYSATGNVSRSEDLAQETFVTAWKQLKSLREPERLRSWLCEIARNLINNSIRRNTREPAHHAQTLDHAYSEASPEMLPSEKLISREEESIVWGALERMPASYREPLILFYRESASVERIATQLDLSTDAVKQRLSRGRDMLRSEVAGVVEGALKRTRPGRMFTFAVMAALPGVVTTSAKAAVLGAAGKAAAPVAKGLLAGGGLAALLGPLVGLLGGGFGVWASWQNARYQSQRDLVRRAAFFFGITTVTFTLGTFALRLVRREWLASHPLAFGIGLVGWIFGFVALLLIYSLRLAAQTRKVTAREMAAGTAPLPRSAWGGKMNQLANRWEGRQWQSRTRLLGLPLVDINFGSPNGASLVNRVTVNACFGAERRRARGWIAFGDRAEGIFLAMGNVAFGGVAIGGFSAGGIAIGGGTIGLISIGGGALGLLALGGMAAGGLAWGGGAIGALAFGGLAVGWLAFGGGAFGWKAAKGGLAYAHQYAVGGHAIAPHANDALAKDFVASSYFFQNAEWQMQHLMPLMQGPWVMVAILTVSLLLPATILAVGYRRRQNRPQNPTFAP